MGFCSKCGEKVPEDAYFCSRCGARTVKGTEAGVSTPAEELRDAFSRAGEEMVKAFKIAAKEMQEAFKTTRGSIQESTSAKPIACRHCGGKNRADSSFCQECGKKLD